MPCGSPQLLSCTPPCLQDVGWGLGAPALAQGTDPGGCAHSPGVAGAMRAAAMYPILYVGKRAGGAGGCRGGALKLRNQERYPILPSIIFTPPFAFAKAGDRSSVT